MTLYPVAFRIRPTNSWLKNPFKIVPVPPSFRFAKCSLREFHLSRPYPRWVCVNISCMSMTNAESGHFQHNITKWWWNLNVNKLSWSPLVSAPCKKVSELSGRSGLVAVGDSPEPSSALRKILCSIYLARTSEVHNWWEWESNDGRDPFDPLPRGGSHVERPINLLDVFNLLPPHGVS